jgi:RimJ/RimL family protein N-acetyltransferase
LTQKYSIKKLNYRNISLSYLKTINHHSTKKFILFSKKKKIISKKDLSQYIKRLKKNDYMFGVYGKKKHLANFKITINEDKAIIGFLVFLNHRGKGLIKKIFSKILNLRLIKKNKIKYFILGVDKNNLRAIKLYQSLGFKYKKNKEKIMFYKI